LREERQTLNDQDQEEGDHTVRIQLALLALVFLTVAGCMQSPAREDQPDPVVPQGHGPSPRVVETSARSGPAHAIGRITVKFVLNLSEFDMGQLTEDERYDATLKLNSQVAERLAAVLGDQKGWKDPIDLELPPKGVLTEKEARAVVEQNFKVRQLSTGDGPAPLAMDVERICTPEGVCHWVIKTSVPLTIAKDQLPAAGASAEKVPWFEEVKEGSRTIRAPIMAELMYADPGFWNLPRP
jgi:hypothetical protein